MITFIVKNIKKREYYVLHKLYTNYIVRVKVFYDGKEKEWTLLVDHEGLDSKNIKQSFIDAVSIHIRGTIELERMKQSRNIDLNSIIGESFTI